MTRRLSTFLVLAMALSLAACSRTEESLIGFAVRDQTRYDLLQDNAYIRVILCGTGSPRVNSTRDASKQHTPRTSSNLTPTRSNLRVWRSARMSNISS